MTTFTGWLIYDQEDAKRNKTYINWFIDEAHKQSIHLVIKLRESVSIGIKDNEPIIHYSGQRQAPPDFAIVRTMEPFLNYHFEQMGVQTFNSSNISQVANHKSWTYIQIQKLDIPILETHFFPKAIQPIAPPLPYPFVLKEATGRGGKNVFYIQSKDEYDKHIQAVSEQDYIMQEANVQLGKDVRVFVIGKHIIAAVLRESTKDFKANFTLGGHARLYTLSPEQKTIVQKIIDHFDFGLIGIDFLINQEGQFVFNEIEDVVGSRTLSHLSDINLLEMYVTFIKNKLITEK